MLENDYETDVFLSGAIANTPDLQFRDWVELQALQYDYLRAAGASADSVVLDVGCGPLRLGSRLIPDLTAGWYYGIDINGETLAIGRDVLDRLGVSADRVTLIESTDFDVAAIDRPVDFAIANSVFSHLNLNSIARCLLNVAEVLRPGAALHATYFDVSLDRWNSPQSFVNFGREFPTYPRRDPYHYTQAMMADVAAWAGLSFRLDPGYAHQCQTMAVFTREV